MEHSSFCLC